MDRTAPPPATWHVKPCLQQAISVLEACYSKAPCQVSEYARKWGSRPVDDDAVVRSDLDDLRRSQSARTVSTLVCLAVESAVRRQLPTIWCGRRCSPVTATLLIHCAQAGVAPRRAVYGRLLDEDFPRLTSAAGRMAAAPLVFCDVRNGASAVGAIEALAVRRTLRVAVCDWAPSRDEHRSFQAASRRWGLTVFFSREAC